MKKVLIFIAIVMLVIAIITGIVFKKNNHTTRLKCKIKIEEFNIKDRTSVKNGSVILVGENVKELDNGYYDLKIVNGEVLEIYLNKLWYKKFNKSYIQDDYLANICHEIVFRINIKDYNDELEYLLYKYIKDNYVNVRNNKVIEDINLEELTVSLKVKDNIPILEIKGV